LLDRTEPDNELGPGEGFAGLRRAWTPRLELAEAIRSFALVETGYDAPAALREAERCLRCDLRFLISPAPTAPEPWMALTRENLATVPEAEGVYQLLDENRAVYALQGVRDLEAALAEILDTSNKSKFFLFEQDPMYSKRESELIQEYLQEHGCMPPGEGEDELDDLF
jgi:formate dehydrogenase beta subunit